MELEWKFRKNCSMWLNSAPARFMKLPNVFGRIAILSALAMALAASAEPVRYQGRPGSKLKLEGTSTVHDWTVESGIIGGYIEFESDVPLDPSLASTEVKVTPKVQVTVPVSSLKSGKSLMDDIMHDDLKIKDS